MSELIDRQAAIDALDKRFDNIPMEQTAEILMLRKDLRELPTIQPEAKRGRWLINSDGYYPYCSVCMEEPESGVMTDYCPNCGARMKGEQDGH